MQYKYMKAGIFVAILFILVGIVYASSGENTIFVHTSSVSPTITWLPNGGTQNITLNITNELTSLNNITGLDISTSEIPLSINISSIISCPLNWTNNDLNDGNPSDGYTDKISCTIGSGPSSSKIQPGESTLISFTAVANIISKGNKTTDKWSVVTIDENTDQYIAGNVYFGIDAKGPTLNITTPIESSHNARNVTINVTAIENEVKINVSTFSFNFSCLTGNYVVTAPIVSCNAENTSCNFSFIWDSSINTTDGNCSIIVRLNDTFNNVGNYTRNIFLDHVPPEIILESPSNNSIIKSGVIINFTIKDDSPINLVWYSLDSGVSNSTLTLPYKINTTSWTNGEYNLSIWANDSLGNLKNEKFRFIVDNNPPNLTINLPMQGWYGSNIPINISADDNTNVSSVLFRWQNTTTNGSWNSLSKVGDYWIGEFSTTSLADGNYTFNFNATDVAGNWINKTISDIAVDKTKPNILIIAPQDGDTHYLSSYINVIANVSDNGAGINPNETCEVWLGGQFIGNINYDSILGRCNGDAYISSSIGTGTKILRVYVNDVVNNSNQDAISVVLKTKSSSGGGGGGTNIIYPPKTNNAPELTPPKVSNEEPTINDTIFCESGIYSDKDGDAKVSEEWRWYKNGVKLLVDSHKLDLMEINAEPRDVFFCAQRVSDGNDFSEWVLSSNRAIVKEKIQENVLEESSVISTSEEGRPTPPTSITGAFIGGLGEGSLLETVVIISIVSALGTIFILRLFWNRKIHVKLR